MTLNAGYLVDGKMQDSKSVASGSRNLADVSRFGLFIARRRRSILLRKLAILGRHYLDWFGNLNYNVSTNGEAFVLKTLARFEPRTLFDVGANVGDWTRVARALCREAEIHAFEIAAPTFETLVANTAHLEKVHCGNVGLSDAPGAIRIRHFRDFPEMTTSTNYPHPFDSVELIAQVVTGDSYARNNGLHHIDIVKIDVEGMEEQVLKGFDSMLAHLDIDLVQFEYGRVNILSHFLLRDFYAFFGERGYLVGKIFPTYVEFREYNLGDEDFMGPNFLACRKDKFDLLQALSGGLWPPH